MKLRRGDEVIVLSGRDKGRKGKIIKVYPRLNRVVVDGVNIVKRAYKPSTTRPKGGIKEEPRPLHAAKLGVVHPTKSGRGSRIGYVLAKGGTKRRVYRQAGAKEIKDNQ